MYEFNIYTLDFSLEYFRIMRAFNIPHIECCIFWILQCAYIAKSASKEKILNICMLILGGDSEITQD